VTLFVNDRTILTNAITVINFLCKQTIKTPCQQAYLVGVASIWSTANTIGAITMRISHVISELVRKVPMVVETMVFTIHWCLPISLHMVTNCNVQKTFQPNPKERWQSSPLHICYPIHAFSISDLSAFVPQTLDHDSRQEEHLAVICLCSDDKNMFLCERSFQAPYHQCLQLNCWFCIWAYQMTTLLSMNQAASQTECCLSDKYSNFQHFWPLHFHHHK